MYSLFCPVGDLVGKVAYRGDPASSLGPVSQGCHEGLMLSIYLLFLAVLSAG